MTALGLGDIAAFPFIDPPDQRNISDGVKLLRGARRARPSDKTDKRLTPLGRKLAQLPVDPRLARMVLEADRNGCVQRGHGDRRRAVHPGPAGAAGRAAAGRRREARPLRRQGLRLPRLPQPVAATCGAAEGAVLQPVPQAVQGGVPELPAGARVAGHLQPAAPGRRTAWASRRTTTPADRSACTARCWPGCSPTSAAGHRATGTTSGARGARFAVFPGSALFKKHAALGDGRRTGRDLPAVGPGRRADRAGVGRAARRAPGQAHLQRAALGASRAR